MMHKKIQKKIRNIVVSFLFVVLFDVIYSFLGLLVLARINTMVVPAVINVALLCCLLFVGYMVGKRFLGYIKLQVVSIVLIPMILIFLLFCLGSIGVPLIGLVIQYPASVLRESFGVANGTDDDYILFYIIVIMTHLACCLSLLIGSRHKKNTYAE